MGFPQKKQSNRPVGKPSKLLGGPGVEDIYAQHLCRDEDTMFTWWKNGEITRESRATSDRAVVRKSWSYDTQQFLFYIAEDQGQMDDQRAIALAHFLAAREAKREKSYGKPNRMERGQSTDLHNSIAV